MYRQQIVSKSREHTSINRAEKKGIGSPPRPRSQASSRLARKLQQDAAAIQQTLEETQMNRIIDELMADLDLADEDEPVEEWRGGKS